MLEVTPKNSSATSGFVPKGKISFEDFLVEYDGQFAEWIDGEVFLDMSASDRHQDLVSFLSSILRCYVEENDLGVIRTAPLVMKMQKTERGRESDLLFVSKKNLDRLKKNYLDGAADLVIEIISPESRGRDRGDKFYEYEKEGVKEYWLIDYERKQAEFYNPDKKGIYQLSTPDENNIFHSRAVKNLKLERRMALAKKAADSARSSQGLEIDLTVLIFKYLFA